MTGSPSPSLRLHGRLARSQANGPGLRAVIWFQGCTLGCLGCFNPESHDTVAGEAVPVSTIVDEIMANADGLEGLTVSGGEPFQQSEALHALLAGVRSGSTLSTLVFTGYRLDEIGKRPIGRACLDLIDVLVAGRYVPTRRRAQGLLGSSNQNLHLLSRRYRPEDLAGLPDAEVQIDTAGRVRLTGVAAPELG